MKIPVKFFKQFLLASTLVLLLPVFLHAQAPRNFASHADWKDAREKVLEGKISELRKKGVTDPAEYQAARQDWQNENISMENRADKMKKLLGDMGLTEDDFVFTGRDPRKGQGYFGDYEGTLKTGQLKTIRDDEDFIALLKRMKDNKIPYKLRADGAIELLKDNIVIHRSKPTNEFPYSRANDKEIFISVEPQPDGTLKVSDKHVFNLDNMKKATGNLFKDAKDMSYVNWQETGKMTGRMIRNTYGSNLENAPPARKKELQDLLDKCDRLYNGEVPEELGVRTTTSKTDLQNRIKETVKDCFTETQKVADARDADLAKKRNDSWKEMQDAKKECGEAVKKHDLDGLEKAKEKLKTAKDSFNKNMDDLNDFRQKRHAGEKGVVSNQGEEVLSYVKGEPVKKTISQSGDIEFISQNTGERIPKSKVQEILVKKSRTKLIDSFTAEIPGNKQINEQFNLDPPPAQVRPSLVNSPKFRNGVDIADGLVNAVTWWNQAGEMLPDDANPILKYSAKGAAAGVAIIGIRVPAVGVVVGAGTIAYDEAFKELVKYEEAVGRGEKPSLTAARLRMFNNYLARTGGEFVYGVTVQPLVNINDIGTSIGGTIYDRRIAAKAKETADKQQAETGGAKAEAFTGFKTQLDRMEKEIQDSLKSTDPEEQRRARAALADINVARRALKDAEEEEKNRSSKVDLKGDADSRINSFQFLKDRIAKADDSCKNVKKEKEIVLPMEKKEADVSLKIVDEEDGSPVRASVKLNGYNSYNGSGSSVKFSSIPIFKDEVDVSAPGYEGKRRSLNVNASKSNLYTATIPLRKLAEPEKPKPLQQKTEKQIQDVKKEKQASAKSADALLKEFYNLMEEASNRPCPKCGNDPMSAYLTGGEDSLKSKVFCPKCGYSMNASNTKTSNGKSYTEEYSALLRNASKPDKDFETTELNKSDTKEKLTKERDDKIAALKAEGNTKLDAIRAELKTLETKGVSMPCPQCGKKATHSWDGTGWSCIGCGATVITPGEYPTSKGKYRAVKEEYQKKIADLEEQYNRKINAAR